MGGESFITDKCPYSQAFEQASYGLAAGLYGSPAFGQDLDSALPVAEFKTGIDGSYFTKSNLGISAEVI